MSVGVPKTRRLWRDRRFVTFWLGDGVSTFGDRITELAVPLIAVTTLRATPADVGLLVAAVWAPNLVSVFVGAWVERQASKKRLLIVANLIQAAAVVSLPVAHLVAEVTLMQLFVVALVQGFGGVLAHTSSQPFFVRLIPKDAYVDANALLSGTRSASFIVGPALGGALIQAFTAPMAMLVDAVSFCFSAIAIKSVRVDERRTEPLESGSLLRQVGTGLRFVRGHPYLRPALACVTTSNFFSYTLNAVLIFFAVRTLGLTPALIGLALGIGAIGGLLGAMLARPLGRQIGAGRSIACGAIAFAAPFALLPLAGGTQVREVAILAGVEFVSSAGVMVFDIHLNAVQTVVTPDTMRSRCTGVFGTINYGVRPLGATLGGLAAGLVGIGPVIIGSAVGGTLAVLWLVGSPIMRVAKAEDLDLPAA